MESDRHRSFDGPAASPHRVASNSFTARARSRLSSSGSSIIRKCPTPGITARLTSGLRLRAASRFVGKRSALIRRRGTLTAAQGRALVEAVNALHGRQSNCGRRLGHIEGDSFDQPSVRVAREQVLPYPGLGRPAEVGTHQGKEALGLLRARAALHILDAVDEHQRGDPLRHELHGFQNHVATHRMSHQHSLAQDERFGHGANVFSEGCHRPVIPTEA